MFLKSDLQLQIDGEDSGARHPGFSKAKLKEIVTGKMLKRYMKLDGPTDVLCLAVVEGDLAPAKLAIAEDADVNACHPALDLPIIHIAAGYGFRDIVRTILATERCDLTVRDKFGRLPSDCAAQCAHDYELAEELAQAQAQQFRSSGKDPRRPTAPDYGSFVHEPT